MVAGTRFGAPPPPPPPPPRLQSHLVCYAVSAWYSHLDIVETIRNGHIFHYVTRVDNVYNRDSKRSRSLATSRGTIIMSDSFNFPSVPAPWTICSLPNHDASSPVDRSHLARPTIPGLNPHHWWDIQHHRKCCQKWTCL